MSLDLFATDRPNATLHPDFVKVRDDPRNAPARAMMTRVAERMEDPDGNLIEQFQTFGFDARTFEIYLDALFRSEGHTIDRSQHRPDFMIERDGVRVAVEAVTSNPTPNGIYQRYEAIGGPPLTDMAGIVHHLRNEVQIRMGSALYSKLQKRYWELPHLRGLPFVIAFQPFHEAGSLGLSSTSLANLLMGLEHQHRFENGRLIVEAKPVTEHKGSKTIPSSFFTLPGAENISAILFCNAGTVPKFNRLGVQDGLAAGSVRLVRHGTCYDHTPNSAVHAIFAYEVGSLDAPTEPWRDGAVVIHNPHATVPLPQEWLGAMSEEALEGATVVTTWRDHFLPYRSLTQVMTGNTSDRAVRKCIIDAFKLLRLEQSLAHGARR